MTSLRIDGDKSAKVWAKRLANFLKAMQDDGAEFAFNAETHEVAVLKDGKFFDEHGRDISDEF